MYSIYYFQKLNLSKKAIEPTLQKDSNSCKNRAAAKANGAWLMKF